MVNIGETPYEVTVSPLHCCLEIDVNDTDCEVLTSKMIIGPWRQAGVGHMLAGIHKSWLHTLQVMHLRPSRTLLLGSENTYDNRTGSVSFLFRNLVCCTVCNLVYCDVCNLVYCDVCNLVCCTVCNLVYCDVCNLVCCTVCNLVYCDVCNLVCCTVCNLVYCDVCNLVYCDVCNLHGVL